MPEAVTYRIEFLHGIEQLRQCLDIQKAAWGYQDADLLPLRSLVVCTKIGGQVFGAVDDSEKVLGFLNAIPGYRDSRIYLHSQMMGVRPEYQNLGIGKRLKLAQREEALTRGINRIEWTFDPLEIRNARFNIGSLGVICRRYLVNTYGITSSRLHGGLPTDRLVAEWHLDKSRVKSVLGAAASIGKKREVEAVVELPLEIEELKSRDVMAAIQVQMEIRQRILDFFDKQLCITGFEVDQTQKKARYLFTPLELDTPIS